MFLDLPAPGPPERAVGSHGADPLTSALLHLVNDYPEATMDQAAKLALAVVRNRVSGMEHRAKDVDPTSLVVILLGELLEAQVPGSTVLDVVEGPGN